MLTCAPPPPQDWLLRTCVVIQSGRATGCVKGQNVLRRFYSYGLEKAFDAKLYRDFESTTLKVRPALLAWDRI